jgi:hypothetical protein
MGRMVKNWKPIKTADIEVSPHRYRWNGSVGADGQHLSDIENAKDYKSARACIPYSEGDVIYVERAGGFCRALIYVVLAHTRTIYGERRECYKVQYETSNGTFSKVWEYTHPGFIQRGYARAGLAPEMPSDEQEAA